MLSVVYTLLKTVSHTVILFKLPFKGILHFFFGRGGNRLILQLPQS